MNNIIVIIFNREPWALYRLSYLWYTMTGALVTMSVSLIVTLITSEDVEKLDPMLVAPFVRKYLKTSKKNITSEELHQIKVLFFYITIYIIVYYLIFVTIKFDILFI